MILCQADTRVHPGSLLHEVNPLQARKQGKQICELFSWTEVQTLLGEFYHLIYLFNSLISLVINNNRWTGGVFCFAEGLEANFSFFSPYRSCRATHRRAFLQEKQHYMPHALRTASTVTPLKDTSYITQKNGLPQGHTHIFEKLEIFEHLQGQLA